MKIKLFLLIIVFPLSGAVVISQDLIVNAKNDSINCRITRVNKEYIYFTFKKYERYFNTLLPQNQVQYYQYNYFKRINIPENKTIRFRDYPIFRISLSGGYGYQTAKISEDTPPDFMDYARKLKSGFQFSGDATCYFTRIMGAGIQYSVFNSSNNIEHIQARYPNGSVLYGSMSDDITISFIGATYSCRFISRSERNSLLLDYAFGYLSFRNDFVLIDPMKLTGATLGSSLGIGYDIGISDNMMLGFRISMLSGTLYSYKLDDGTTIQTIKAEKDKAIGLGRIDLSVGLRFNL